MLMLDLTSALDTVDHKILLNRLHKWVRAMNRCAVSERAATCVG